MCFLNFRNAFPLSFVSSILWPFRAKNTCPSVGSIARKIDRPTVVLPEPLSPTNPSVSPCRILNETLSTARAWPLARPNMPVRMGKYTLRLLTSIKATIISFYSYRTQFTEWVSLTAVMAGTFVSHRPAIICWQRV